MKKFCLLIVFFCFIPYTINSQTNNKIVLTSSDLEFIAVTRLSDIFNILPQLDTYTIDNYRHTTLTGNLFANAPGDIMLFLNGVKTNYGIWNKINISQFPVHLNSIDSIIVILNPIQYKGEFSSGVLVDIISKKPSDGISFTGTYSTGNETGDPGPFRYTEHTSENVDQFGPNTSFEVAYGGRNFHVNLSFIDQVSPATDPAMLKRINNFVFQNYQVRYSGFSLNSSTMSDFGRHSLFASFSKTGQAIIGFEYGADLFFVDEYGCEFPYENENYNLLLSNKLLISENDNLIIDAGLNYNLLEQSKFSDAFRFNSGDLWLYSKVAYESNFSNIKYLFGTSLEYHKFNDELTDFSYSRKLPSLLASVNFSSLDNLNHFLDLNYRSNETNDGYFIGLNNIYRIDKKNIISLSLSHTNLFNIRKSLDNTIKKGYIFLNNFGYQNYDQDNIPAQNILKFDYSYSPDEKTSFNSGIIINHYKNLDYLMNDFVFNPYESRIDNLHSEIFRSIQGTQSGITLGYSNRMLKNIEQKIFYRFAVTLSGDEIFEKIMNRIPVHKLFYSVYFSPFKDLITSLSVSYYSPAEWIEYRNIYLPDGDLYLSKLEGRILINWAATKKLWNERLRISAMIFNLLNSRIQYHPVGGRFDLTFYIKAEVNL